MTGGLVHRIVMRAGNTAEKCREEEQNPNYVDPDAVRLYAHVAQLVEHDLGKVEAGGSTPPVGSRR